MSREAMQVKYDLGGWEKRKMALLPVLQAAAGEGVIATAEREDGDRGAEEFRHVAKKDEINIHPVVTRLVDRQTLERLAGRDRASPE